MKRYVDSLKPEARNAQAMYVRKFVEHHGDQVTVASLTGSRVESYAETSIKPSDPMAQDRVAALKAWFQYLKKQNLTTQNFGIHIRVRRTATSRAGSSAVRLEEVPIEMTAEGIADLQKEMEGLNAAVPDLVMEIAKAREDKDFRENSPLEAAREALAYNEGRRREVERTLKRAVVVDRKGADESAVGSTVTVTRVDDGKQFAYRLVGAREANANEMKISVESPVGRGLLGKRPGDEVTVTVNAGNSVRTIEYRVDAVSHSS
jgi:transcription elongation factor GreA